MKRRLIVCLAAVLAAVCLCDLLLGPGGICLWARRMRPVGIVSAEPWGGDPLTELAPLSEEARAELTSLLNGLTRKDFTQNRHLQGGTPTYGIRLTTRGGIFHLNQAISPHGTLEVEHLGTLWWIDSDALSAFVRKVTAPAGENAA